MSENKYGLPLDLRPADIIQLATFIVAIAVFIAMTNQRLTAMEGITKYVFEFTKRSDGYHSSTTGKRFEQGAPAEAIEGKRYGRE